jgi:hypothetical protein
MERLRADEIHYSSGGDSKPEGGDYNLREHNEMMAKIIHKTTIDFRRWNWLLANIFIS